MTQNSQEYPGSSLHAEKVALARKVHRQVWTDFHVNKPPRDRTFTRERSVKFAESSAQGSRRALHEQLKVKYPDRINDVPEVIPPDGPDNVGTSVSVSASSSHSRSAGVITNIPKSGRTTSKVRAVPAYTWCDRVQLSVRVFSETLLPFVPMCVEDDAKAITYNHMFHEAAWAIAGRDPDADIIGRETIRRLTTEHHMPEEVIDATRILPQHCDLYGRLGDLRDLAEFPRGDEPPYVRTWKRHKIDEAPQEAYLQNQESHCPQCMTYNCQSHIGQSGHESSGIRPLPTFEPHELELKNPDEACSQQCTLHFQSASSISTNVKQSTGTAVRRCSRDESLQLLNILPISRKSGMTYCRVANIIYVPCQAVAQELQARKKRVVERPETKPQTESQEQRSRDKSPALPIDSTQYRQFSYCRHAGPCVKGVCFCVDSQMGCEARCHCDSRCTQRWKGCSCHRHTANKPQKCSSNKCECRQAARECNSAVCVGCGTWREIDSEHGRDEVGEPRPKPTRKGPDCQNRATLRAPRADTVVKESQGMGYGLYATKSIAKGAVIGEYVGEIINNAESNRRHIIYDAIKRNYIWEMADGIHHDAFNIGNETRFINGDEGPKVNVYGAPVNVQGDPRMLIKASRHIKQGEELFLFYGHLFYLEDSQPGPSTTVARNQPNKNLGKKRPQTNPDLNDDDPNDPTFRKRKKSKKARAPD